jgi:ribonucleoside-diphosphate reductase alpha chain
MFDPFMNERKQGMKSMAINVVKRDGSIEPLQIDKIHRAVEWACDSLDVSLSDVEMEAHLMLFDGIHTSDIHKALTQAAATLISVEKPDYTFVAARLLLQQVYKEVTGGDINYPGIKPYIEKGVSLGRLTPELLDVGFDFEKLDAAIDQKRDFLFTYLGLQSLVDRYFVRDNQKAGSKNADIIELPQHMWMRIAMGLAIREDDQTARAIEFYNVLSQLEFVSSTPTLFNSGTLHSQLSSCYLNTVADSIDYEGKLTEANRYASIFGTIQECANLSKFAGGIGTDWTRVRGEGDPIVSTNGKSSGIVPYLKVYNDTAIAVNQGGKRNGAFAPYLETWHPDLYDFIELKKNSGDERRRTHDIYPAAWIPDLLMKRKDMPDAVWSFFSPNEYPELHELYGEAFEERYEQLEAEGKFRFQKPALEVWRKIVSSLFETGHPWITFKDECNRRNPQDHVGVIHNSNLCTEITLNTSDDETAVCNLGSVNLSRVSERDHLKRVVHTGMRMLDNVIDINFYPSERARNSNMRHRPVGMGVMGYTEYLVQNGIDWESEEHLEAADRLFEAWSYFAIEASMELAKERGAYETFKGSKWSKGILPIDTARDYTPSNERFDWGKLRTNVKKFGMRNSNVMALAPTATISNIAGTTPTIEAPFLRFYTKSNLSGSFLVVDPTLRYGKPELCKEMFEIDQLWVVRAAAVRQRWIDQSQSVNIFAKDGTTGRQLDEIYSTAWKLGLKTTYYLRSQPKGSVKEVAPTISETIMTKPSEAEPVGATCSLEAIMNGSCDSCQ